MADTMTGIYKPRHTRSFTKGTTTAGTQTAILPETRQKLIDEHEAKKKEKGGENLNQRAAVIHLLGDMVQSIGVISAAIIIKVKPAW